MVVGICFQCDADADADCFDLSGLRPEWRANVRTLRMRWQDARGPVWARFLIQSRLFQAEDYVLQIDSHTRVAPGWDVELIEMLGRCDSPKPVLTTYPLPYEGMGDAASLSKERRLTVLCTRAAADGAFGPDGMLRFRARLLTGGGDDAAADAAAPLHSPVPTPFWAAGFSFSSGRLVREVPTILTSPSSSLVRRSPSRCACGAAGGIFSRPIGTSSSITGSDRTAPRSGSWREVRSSSGDRSFVCGGC